jgi:hypothetical protein
MRSAWPPAVPRVSGRSGEGNMTQLSSASARLAGRLGLAFTSLLAGVPLVASAATVDPKISMPASSVPETVTVSTSSTQQTPVTYVAYLVTLNNGGGSDINLVQLDAATSVTSGLTPALIQGSSVNPALPSACAVSGTTLDCAFGTLAPGAVLSFPVIVAVPQYATTPVANQSITLSLHASFREGKSNNASDNSLGELSTTVQTPVAPQSDSSLKSVVVKAGGSFFTGGNGIPKPVDVYTSSVAFQPLAATFSLVTITESPFEPSQSALCVGGRHFKTCHSTLLFAPQVLYALNAGFLTETLRVHPSNFVNGAKMNTVIWDYVPTDGAGLPAGAPTTVGLCASPTTPRTDGIPCQSGPVLCYKKSTPGWTPELDGVCEWKFLNTRNGFMRGY